MKDYSYLSSLIDEMSPDELLQVASPRQLIRALRVYEKQSGKRILYHRTTEIPR